MKQLFIFTATILACMGMRAQETGIDSVLRQIEANNKELQANAQLISSQKLESRTENPVGSCAPFCTRIGFQLVFI